MFLESRPVKTALRMPSSYIIAAGTRNMPATSRVNALNFDFDTHGHLSADPAFVLTSLLCLDFGPRRAHVASQFVQSDTYLPVYLPTCLPPVLPQPSVVLVVSLSSPSPPSISHVRGGRSSSGQCLARPALRRSAPSSLFGPLRITVHQIIILDSYALLRI